jgi:hypothetical protein
MSSDLDNLIEMLKEVLEGYGTRSLDVEGTKDFKYHRMILTLAQSIKQLQDFNAEVIDGLIKDYNNRFAKPTNLKGGK